MIIWGSSTKNIASRITDLSCINCKENGLVYFAVQKFFTLFFIPTFPLEKDSYLSCSNCEHTFGNNVFETFIKNNIKEKTPWWGWSGAVLISLLIGFGIYTTKAEKETTTLIRSHPEVDDIIFIKDSAASSKTPYTNHQK